MLDLGEPGFTCPECRHKNLRPETARTDGGTDVVLCAGCGLQVSRAVIADSYDRARRAYSRALGWGDALA